MRFARRRSFTFSDTLGCGLAAHATGVGGEGLGGFRWEDNAVVTAEGAVRLAETDYGLD